MATTAGRGILALGTVAALLVIGVLLALLVDPFARMPIEVDAATEWIARVLLVLGVAWVVIGMLAARTRLVGRPGAAAARHGGRDEPGNDDNCTHDLSTLLLGRRRGASPRGHVAGLAGESREN